MDKVLFALLHEIAHILLGHVDCDTYIVEVLDDELGDHEGDAPGAKASNEAEANRKATRWVLPNGLGRVPERIGAPWIADIAAREGIAPIVLVGQLQHMKRLDWRTTLARKAPTVTEFLQTWS